MITIHRLARRVAAALGLLLAAAGAVQAQGTVGTTFPPGFGVFDDASLGKPVIGFGGALPASGKVSRTPVIFLHGNGGTPYFDSTTCANFSADIRGMAQYLADSGYDPSELWALGYLGTGCEPDPVTNIIPPAYNASLSNTVSANVLDLHRFVKEVLRYTRAEKVDIVAHGMGVVLAREWYRQYDGRLVRRFVAIDGPNDGMILCSAHPLNPWQLPAAGGFAPDSPLCEELGSPDTPFLKVLNRAGTRIDPRETLVIRNGDRSFLFRPEEDGLLMPTMPTPVVDSYGKPADFSGSASIKRAAEMVLHGQGWWDLSRSSAHVGIANSPHTHAAVLQFLRGY